MPICIQKRRNWGSLFGCFCSVFIRACNVKTMNFFQRDVFTMFISFSGIQDICSRWCLKRKNKAFSRRKISYSVLLFLTSSWSNERFIYLHIFRESRWIVLNFACRWKSKEREKYYFFLVRFGQLYQGMLQCSMFLGHRDILNLVWLLPELNVSYFPITTMLPWF